MNRGVLSVIENTGKGGWGNGDDYGDGSGYGDSYGDGFGDG